MKAARILLVLFALLAGAPAGGEEAWRAEFDRVCGKTEQSMTLPVEELRELVDRCRKLKPQIEAGASPQKKIFLKRLEACEKVFAFVLEASTKAK